MKVYDCFMYYDEDTVVDIRLNCLDTYVDKFVIIESKFTHSGKKRDLLFDIKKFKHFENKINYFILDHEPNGIETVDDNDDEGTKSEKYILNATKRENYQRNYLSKGFEDADPDDIILISDIDEIPNLEKIKFKSIKNKLIFFQQKIFYYKFNLCLNLENWVGTKVCKKKDLLSFSWLREVKTKKYPFFRFDTIFSKTKYKNIEIIEDGGWHFTQLKTAKDIEIKLVNSEIHGEIKSEGINLQKISGLMKRKTIDYDHKANSVDYKYSKEFKLKALSLEHMPTFLKQNVNKYSEWFDIDK